MLESSPHKGKHSGNGRCHCIESSGRLQHCY